MAMTAATPIKMPSVVRAERVLLRVSALRATESVRGKTWCAEIRRDRCDDCRCDRGGCRCDSDSWSPAERSTQRPRLNQPLPENGTAAKSDAVALRFRLTAAGCELIFGTSRPDIEPWPFPDAAVPSSSIRPSRMRMIRCACWATARSCVTRMIVIPEAFRVLKHPQDLFAGARVEVSRSARRRARAGD